MTSIDPSHFPSISLTPGNPSGAFALHHPSLSHDSFSSDLSSHSPIDDESLGSLKDINIPDLRFEQGYLMSLRPFFSLEPRTEKSKIESSIQLNSPRISSKDEIDDLFYLGRHFRVQWRLVIWVTLRDQVFYPLMQGCMWGTISFVIAHLWRARLSKRSQIALVDPTVKPSGIWERMFGNLFGGLKSNVALTA